MLLECCMRLDGLLIVTDDKVLNHVIMVLDSLFSGEGLVCSNGLERRYSAIFIMMDLLEIGYVLWIVCYPADIIRVFVQDVN